MFLTDKYNSDYVNVNIICHSNNIWTKGTLIIGVHALEKAENIIMNECMSTAYIIS